MEVGVDLHSDRVRAVAFRSEYNGIPEHRLGVVRAGEGEGVGLMEGRLKKGGIGGEQKKVYKEEGKRKRRRPGGGRRRREEAVRRRWRGRLEGKWGRRRSREERGIKREGGRFFVLQIGNINVTTRLNRRDPRGSNESNRRPAV